MNKNLFHKATFNLCKLLTLMLICSMSTASPTTINTAADNYFDRYGLAPASPTIDLGVQPLGFPSGVISAAMQRDRILKMALEQVKQPLKAHAFLRGADMVDLLGAHKLEAGLLGDMPTILSASSGNIWVVGLVKQTSTAIVARGDGQVASLIGKRIAYVPVSSAHHTLLQGLASAGLDETQVKLISMRSDEMPGALERGEIDAFAAWEPAPTLALSNSDKNRIVFRGQSTDYFVIDRDFEKRQPEAARLLTAGFFRAIEWLRRSQANLDQAARWVLADGQALSGKPMTISITQIGAITRREILSIPSAPVILESHNTAPLANEYQFLSKLNKLPAGAKQENVITAFKYDGLARVLAEAKKYQLRTFNYQD
jgi:ABC-type nitrate/sulfonate/bicarbonate transport system substrate-binding protein